MRVLNSDSVTPAWMSKQLQRAGFDVEVASFEVAPIGTGQIGKCLRYTLTFDRDDPRAPRSLVGKFASDDANSRAAGVQFGNFIKEVRFYQELQPRLSIATPRCFYADIEGEGPDCAILLEDLAPRVQGDQLKGTSVDIARSAVLELVGLHAPTWCDPSLRGVDWLGEPDPAIGAETRALYASLMPGFLERFGPALAQDEAEILSAAGQTNGPLFGGLPEPFSVVHVDYRLDNLLIDEGAVPPDVVAVDWQSLTLGRPLADVAYFLGAGLLPEVRRASERGIFQDYHRLLTDAGVSGYGFDACWDDYVRGSFAGFGVTVIASMMVQRTERGDAMFTAMAQRHARHAIDLGAERFLG